MLFKSTVRTSVPKARKVCGYTIQRLPFGAYLQAAERLPGLLSETRKECFPGMEPADVLEMLKHIKESEIAALVTRIGSRWRRSICSGLFRSVRYSGGTSVKRSGDRRIRAAGDHTGADGK